MPQDTNERITLHQFCKALSFFVVFWGVFIAAAMISFSPESCLQVPVVLEGNQK